MTSSTYGTTGFLGEGFTLALPDPSSTASAAAAAAAAAAVSSSAITTIAAAALVPQPIFIAAPTAVPAPAAMPAVAPTAVVGSAPQLRPEHPISVSPAQVQLQEQLRTKHGDLARRMQVK